MNQNQFRFWVSKNNGSELPILLSESEAIQIFYKDSTTLFMPEARNINWCTGYAIGFPPPPPNYNIKNSNENEKLAIQEIFCRTVKKETLEKLFPIPERLLNEYQNFWDWEILSGNPNIKWSEHLIENNLDNLLWKLESWGEGYGVQKEETYLCENKISGNRALPWCESLIARFEYRWDWECLSRNTSIPWNESLLEGFKNKWKWNEISCNPKIPWSKDLLQKYNQFYSWYGLSENEALPWDVDMIDTFIDKWDWWPLSKNRNLPWSHELFERYLSNWDLETINWNPKLPWSYEFIKQYENYWNFDSLSSNIGLPWTYDLLERYRDRWNWDQISSNNSIPWSEFLLEKYSDKINIKGLCSWHNKKFPWTWELLEKYALKLDWEGLAYNTQIPWEGVNLDIFQKFGHYFWRNLCYNECFPWNEHLLETYKTRLNWSGLCGNKGIKWNSYLLNKFSDWIYWDKLLGSSKELSDIVIESNIFNVIMDRINKWIKDLGHPHSMSKIIKIKRIGMEQDEKYSNDDVPY